MRIVQKKTHLALANGTDIRTQNNTPFSKVTFYATAPIFLQFLFYLSSFSSAEAFIAFNSEVDFILEILNRGGDCQSLAGTKNLTLFSTYAFVYADITKNCLQSEAVSFSDQSIATTVKYMILNLFLSVIRCKMVVTSVVQ